MGDYLPGAVRDDKPDGGAPTRALRVGVLHSTEGNGWPAYDSGSGTAPHLTVNPRARETRQHIPFSRAGRALRNEAGGVETNRAGVVQLELVGTCSLDLAVRNDWLYLPGMTGEELSYVAGVMARVHVETGVPLSSSVQWKDYNDGKLPSSYGKDNDVRLTPEQWRGYSGWLGHMHVPENAHGDPGSISIRTLLDKARNIVETTTLSLPVIKPDAPLAPVLELPLPPAAPRETADLGEFPLPLGHWFGPESRDPRVHSGYYAADRQHIAAFLARLRGRGWRDVPGTDRYTSEVAELVGRYQQDADLRRDKRLGRYTWDSARSSLIRR